MEGAGTRETIDSTDDRGFAKAILVGTVVGIAVMAVVMFAVSALLAPSGNAGDYLAIAIWVGIWAGLFLGGTVSVGLWANKRH